MPCNPKNQIYSYMQYKEEIKHFRLTFMNNISFKKNVCLKKTSVQIHYVAGGKGSTSGKVIK